MTPQQIKDRLKEKKLTQAQLADRWGCSTPAVNYLIHGDLTSDRLEKRLARALGVTLEELRAKPEAQAVGQ